MSSWICDEVESQLSQFDDDDYDAQSLIKGAYRDGWYAGDLENPMNWSSWKKARHYIPVSMLCLAVAAGASIITPGTLEIMARFQVSETAALLALSVYVLGLALGPVLAAPISETMGRAVVYKITMPINMAFLAGAGFTNSFGVLLACRFLAGMAGAPCLAVGAGTVADMFEAHEIVTPGSIFIMTAFLGPCVGPVIGSFAEFYKGYRWTQWCSIFLGLLGYTMILFTQETHQKVLRKRRAKRMGLPPPEPELAPSQALKMLLTITIFRPIRMLVTEPIVLCYSLYNGFTFSVLFVFLEAFPYVFSRVYFFNLWQIGLTFSSVGAGVLLGVILTILVDRYLYQRRLVRDEKGRVISAAPEERLYVGMIGAFLLPAGLFMFAFTACAQIHWIVPILAGIPFALGNVTVFISAALYLIDVYGALSGASAMAAIGILRYLLGAAFPLFTVQMYDALGIKWATALLGFVCVAMLPIPFVFYRFGSAIRRRSRYSEYLSR